MNNKNDLMNKIKGGLGIMLLMVLVGCVGYVDSGYRGAVVVPGPDIYLYGGFHESGRDVHDYSRRGYESRERAHPVPNRQERRH